jgi:hypothetical protein
MDYGKQDHCLLEQHLLVMDYHLYDPIQLIVVEHSKEEEKKEEFLYKNVFNHIRELEVEYVVHVDFHLKQYLMVLYHVHHMVDDLYNIHHFYQVQMVVMDLEIICFLNKILF